jgi:hypothetical protein
VRLEALVDEDGVVKGRVLRVEEEEDEAEDEDEEEEDVEVGEDDEIMDGDDMIEKEEEEDVRWEFVAATEEKMGRGN